MLTLTTDHLVALRRYALALMRDPDRAEDLVQETLARAFESAANWDPGRDLRRWLFGILHNTFVSGRRRRGLEAGVAADLAAIAPEAVPPSQPDRVHFNQTMAALMTLPEEQREVLALIVAEGLSYKDAAEVLGVPVGTVMSRLARARQALRQASGRDVEARDAVVTTGSPLLRLVR